LDVPQNQLPSITKELAQEIWLVFIWLVSRFLPYLVLFLFELETFFFLQYFYLSHNLTDWLIENYIEMDTVGMYFGEPVTYKSFLAAQAHLEGKKDSAKITSLSKS
jgi:hypothetical protein